MSKVHILSADIVSKIAAGEVIDRPASVIKECVENALDAQATNINIQLEQAGRRSIIIKDNGSGIAPDDMENIFIRHATSKLKTIEDLYEINSLGFRGEALYSIGAIADVVLQSRTEHEDSGWEIHFRGGEKIDLKPCAQPAPGTEIKIQELFYNTPGPEEIPKNKYDRAPSNFEYIYPLPPALPRLPFFTDPPRSRLVRLEKDLAFTRTDSRRFKSPTRISFRNFPTDRKSRLEDPHDFGRHQYSAFPTRYAIYFY